MIFDLALNEKFIEINKSRVFSLYESARTISKKNNEDLSFEEIYFYKYLDEVYIIPLRERSTDSAKKAADKFIDDANEFINKTSKKMSEERKKSVAHGFIAGGVFILGNLIACSSAAIGIIVMLSSLIPMAYAIKDLSDRYKNYRELEKLYSKLEDIEMRTKDEKVNQKINILMKKINDIKKEFSG